MNGFSMAMIISRVKAIWQMMKDPKVSKGKKALVIFALIYLVSPIDLIPPLIPIFGILDDTLLWAFVLYYLWDVLGQYEVRGEPKKVKKKKFHGKNVIDGVEFEVKEEKTSEENEKEES